MSKKTKILIGLFISGFALYFVFKGFDFEQIQHAVINANFYWFGLGSLIFVINMFMRSIRWSVILSPLKSISLSQICPVLLFGFFMNNILPARGGEVVRAATLHRKTGIPMTSGLGSIILERITDLSGLLIVMIFASQLLPWDKLPIKTISIILSIGITSLIASLVIIRKMKNKKSYEMGFIGKIFHFIERIIEGFDALRSPSKMGGILLLSLIIWVNEVFLVIVISKALHLNLNFFEAAGLITGLSFGVMIPAAPGYIGTYEFFGKEVLGLLGKPENIALPFVVVLHFFQLCMMAILGISSLAVLQSQPHSTESPIKESNERSAS